MRVYLPTRNLNWYPKRFQKVRSDLTQLHGGGGGVLLVYILCVFVCYLRAAAHLERNCHAQAVSQ